MKLVFALVVIFSFSSWAEYYERGEYACDFSGAEQYYNEDSEDLANRELYNICLVIKGEDAKGLPELYTLADYHNSVLASFFVADYLETDGLLTHPPSAKNLDLAIKYYFRTQILINSIPSYPEPDYFFDEKSAQMELNSVLTPPDLFLFKYDVGLIGDYNKHLYQSPSYEGDREGELYPQYNNLMRDSLNQAVEQATHCLSLPKKEHFDSELYSAAIKSCHLNKEQALILLPLEEKRQTILLQPNCKDLNKANCPEYYETHDKILEVRYEYLEKIERVFDPDKTPQPKIVTTASTSTQVVH